MHLLDCLPLPLVLSSTPHGRNAAASLHSGSGKGGLLPSSYPHQKNRQGPAILLPLSPRLPGRRAPYTSSPGLPPASAIAGDAPTIPCRLQGLPLMRLSAATRPVAGAWPGVACAAGGKRRPALTRGLDPLCRGRGRKGTTLQVGPAGQRPSRRAPAFKWRRDPLETAFPAGWRSPVVRLRRHPFPRAAEPLGRAQ